MTEGLTFMLGSVDCHRACCGTSGCSCSAVTLLAHCLQEVLWQRLGKSFEQLHLSAVTVWHLQRVLVKKRDPLTHVCFMDAYLATEDTPLPSDAAWCVHVAPAVREARSRRVCSRVPWAREPPHKPMWLPGAPAAGLVAPAGLSLGWHGLHAIAQELLCMPRASASDSVLSGVTLSPHALGGCKNHVSSMCP